MQNAMILSISKYFKMLACFFWSILKCLEMFRNAQNHCILHGSYHWYTTKMLLPFVVHCVTRNYWNVTNVTTSKVRNKVNVTWHWFNAVVRIQLKFISLNSYSIVTTHHIDIFKKKRPRWQDHYPVAYPVAYAICICH